LARGAVGLLLLRCCHERGAAQRHGFDPPRANRADAQGGEAARPAGEQQHCKEWSRRRRAAFAGCSSAACERSAAQLMPRRDRLLQIEC